LFLTKSICAIIVKIAKTSLALPRPLAVAQDKRNRAGTMASISLNKVTKGWGSVVGVDAIDLEIRDKEFIVFLGPSGCGKTTTMRMIAGLEDLTSGDIKIDGHTVNDVDARDRDVAMVFQSYALYPNMSIYENIRFPLRMRKVPAEKHDELVREAARMVELGDLLERKPKALSGGQRQRAALARAIVRQPQVFLMDEPLSNLDAKLRLAMRAQLKHIQKRLQTTTVYVTHDQIEAMTLADRIAIMSKGKIQQLGTPDEVYNNPSNVFVAGFIGSPPMNLIIWRRAYLPVHTPLYLKLEKRLAKSHSASARKMCRLLPKAKAMSTPRFIRWNPQATKPWSLCALVNICLWHVLTAISVNPSIRRFH
jgi:ABC-type sugar transport system ATPase subunit